MSLNELSFQIRGAFFEIHNELGPGLFESVYEKALAYELKCQGLTVRSQIALPARYKDITLDLGFRIDLIVEESIIIEVKSIEALSDIHVKQLLTYLKLSDMRLGLLVNFNVTKLIDKVSLIRIVN